MDGMSVRVTAFVPEDADARVLLIECAGRARIMWHTDLVCAGRDNMTLTTKASETFVRTMRNDLFAHIQRLPFSWHMKNQTGDIIQRCTSDVDMIRNFVTEQLIQLFRVAVLLVLGLSFMIRMNWRLSMVAHPHRGGLFHLLPSPYFQALHRVRRKRRQAFHHRAGKPDRRAGGSRLRPGSVRKGALR